MEPSFSITCHRRPLRVRPGKRGHPKDGVRGRLQIVYGLLATKEGVPIAILVFAGNPTTIAQQVEKLKGRFGLANVVLV
jgi:transposase